ncbi:MAG: exonuclease SbcCD subunit D [Lachnospiraceae bacterium]|nr:exonuclease SbcCD subunit D [Lachnospiraceae bacterium]
MKLLHLADLHLGKIVKDFNMVDDQRYMLNKVIELIKSENIDAVMIAGDVYDRSIPSEDAVQLFDDFIYELTEIPVKVFLISGNHDSDERLNFGSRIFVEKGVFFAAKYEGNLYKKTLEDEFGPINFYLMPFIKAAQVRAFFPDSEIKNYDDAVRTVLKNSDINTDERNIILAHQFVAGRSGEIALSGSEGVATKHVGLVEQIGFDVFDDFDYAALGHIHKAQAVGREEVRYSGTLLKYHVDEVDDVKSVPIVTIGEKGSVSIEFKEIKPKREMRLLKGTLKQLLSPENITNADDYIIAVLTDEEPVLDVMNIFRQYYPNTMHLSYEFEKSISEEMVDIDRLTEIKSFPELISEFYSQMYGMEISDEELKLMNKIAEEVDVR